MESERKNPNWAKLLMAIYREDGFCKLPMISQGSSDRVQRFSEGGANIHNLTDMSRQETLGALIYLDNTDLITKEGELRKDSDEEGELYYYTLSEKGFEVAHSRELSRESDRINYSLVFLTFTLIIVQVIDTIPMERWVKVFAGIAFLMMMLFISWRTDILDW